MTLLLSILFNVLLIQTPSTDYKIVVWQYGEIVVANQKNIYTLKKDEFQLRFVAKIGYAFQLNANRNKYYHKTDFKLDEWDGKTVSESKSDKSKDLHVDQDANHFFTYRPDDTWSKFDSLILDEKSQTFVGIRTIKMFNLRDQETYDLKEIEVQKMSSKIYITCIITDNKRITGAMSLKGIKHEELDRLKLTLKWK